MAKDQGPHERPGEGEQTRYDRRKAQTKAAILEAGYRLIEARGADAVGLDAVALEASISRATLFNHFSSREELLEALLLPVFDEAIKLVKDCAGEAPRSASARHVAPSGLDVIEKVCKFLWTEHRRILACPGSARSIGCSEALRARHEDFVTLFTGLFRPAPARGELRFPRAETAALLTFRTCIALLDAAADTPDPEATFRAALRGMLLA